MALKQSRFISIAITASLVKIAVTKSSGIVEKVLKQPIDQAGPEAALLKAMRGVAIKGAGVICVIPGDVATTKNLEVPSVDNEEIESILALQATRHTPFSREEILTGYAKLGSPKPHFSRVLLVVVKREIVKEKLALLKHAGLNVNGVVFAPEAIARFYARNLNTKRNEPSFVVLDIGMQDANVIVQDNGAAVFSRNIPVGIEHLSIDAEAKGQLINEIKASLETYKQDTAGSAPTRLLLTTNHTAFAGLDGELSTALGIKVEIVPYVKYTKGEKGVSNALSKDFIDESALDVIAPGVVASKCQVELVPQEVKDQRALAEKGRDTFKAGVLIFLLFVFIGSALFSKVYFKDTFLKNNLVAKYAEQTKSVNELKSMIARSRIVQQFLQSRALPLESVRELYRIVPTEIYLTNVSIDEAGIVSIQGVSDSMSQVFTFVTSLEDSDLFEGVKTKSTTSKKERGKDLAGFEIIFKLTEAPAADAKVEAQQQADQAK